MVPNDQLITFQMMKSLFDISAPKTFEPYITRATINLPKSLQYQDKKTLHYKAYGRPCTLERNVGCRAPPKNTSFKPCHCSNLFGLTSHELVDGLPGGNSGLDTLVVPLFPLAQLF